MTLREEMVSSFLFALLRLLWRTGVCCWLQRQCSTAAVSDGGEVRGTDALIITRACCGTAHRVDKNANGAVLLYGKAVSLAFMYA